MTTVEIGRIISIEYEDDPRFIEIDAQTISTDPDNPTVVPAGAKNTIVLISNLDPQNTNWTRFLKLEDAFNSGDIVELYGTDVPGASPGSMEVSLRAENNQALGGVGGASLQGVVLRKFRTGTQPTWGRF